LDLSGKVVSAPFNATSKSFYYIGLDGYKCFLTLDLNPWTFFANQTMNSLSAQEIDAILGVDLPLLPVMTEGMLIARQGQAAIYMLENGLVRMFRNKHSFFSIGKSFEDVVRVPSWLIDNLKSGGEV
jgi:hypothetical protein